MNFCKHLIFEECPYESHGQQSENSSTVMRFTLPDIKESSYFPFNFENIFLLFAKKPFFFFDFGLSTGLAPVIDAPDDFRLKVYKKKRHLE